METLMKSLVNFRRLTDSVSIFDKAAKTDGKKDEKNGFLFKKFGKCLFSYSHKMQS